MHGTTINIVLARVQDIELEIYTLYFYFLADPPFCARKDARRLIMEWPKYFI
jgi:hypothetical protein